MIYLNGVPITTKRYPNGERLWDATLIDTLIESVADAEVSEVRLHWESDGDLIDLMVLRRHLGIEPLNLLIDYMPYSRMDRSKDGSVFSLQHIIEFINALNWRQVSVLDPHSPVTMQLLGRCEVCYPLTLVTDALDALDWQPEGGDWIVLPDAGAAERYGMSLGTRLQILTAEKKRDFATGRIEGIKLNTPAEPWTGRRALILDDLCSCGGTFVALAKELRKYGFEKVYLVVTHMENAILDGQALEVLDHIWCTDSLCSPIHPKITVVPLGDEPMNRGVTAQTIRHAV